MSLAGSAVAGAVIFVLLSFGQGGVRESRGPLGTPSASAGAAKAASPVEAIEVEPSAFIEIATRPADATLIVQGKQLDRGVRSIPRPATDNAVVLLVKARGYVDRTVTLDNASPTPLEVVLAPKPTPETELPRRPAKHPGVIANPY
jgi:hypothetical protein